MDMDEKEALCEVIATQPRDNEQSVATSAKLDFASEVRQQIKPQDLEMKRQNSEERQQIAEVRQAELKVSSNSELRQQNSELRQQMSQSRTLN
jgi:hypothetical protein